MTALATTSGSTIATPTVRMESPDALFAPDHRVQAPVPAPLHLLSCIRLPLVDGYAMEDGVVKNRGHAYQRNTVVYPDGSRFEAEISASPSLGLPTIFDLDFLFGVTAIADRDGIEPDGTILGASFRRVIQAGRPHVPAKNLSGREIQTAKRALARWGGTSVRTTMEMVFDAAALRVRSGEAEPQTPGAIPSRREREGTHWVLEYDHERHQTGNSSAEEIVLLKFNPIWRSQTDTGLTAWIDMAAHASLDSAIARGIYTRLVLSVAEGWRPTFAHVALLSWWRNAIGMQDSDKPGKIAQRFDVALKALKEREVVSAYEIAPAGRGEYEISITPGPVLSKAHGVRGIGSMDPVRTRVLLYHLSEVGIAAGEGRALLRKYGIRVQDVLQRVRYMRTVKAGHDAKGNPIASWPAWIVSALADSWSFQEPEYDKWLTAQAARLARLPEPPAPPRSAATLPPPAVAALQVDPVVELPDDVWGDARGRIRGELPEQVFRTWLASTWLIEATEERVVVGTANQFAPDWIQDKYGTRLREILEQLLGHPVELTISAKPTPPEGGRGSKAE